MKFFITVKPRSREERVEKINNGYVAYIKEQPIENKANKALIRLLSEYFGVPRSRIAILSGVRSKQKIVEIKDP
jgi:uncharacterized protein YggU (UPF0235/DUF167 family)